MAMSRTWSREYAPLVEDPRVVHTPTGGGGSGSVALNIASGGGGSKDESSTDELSDPNSGRLAKSLTWTQFAGGDREAARLRRKRFIQEEDEAFASSLPALQFAEQPRFQSLVGLTILANTVVLGLETDIRWWGWQPLEQAFLCVFALELILRLLFRGKYYFTLKDDLFWNLFDLMIVSLGVLESWIIPLFSAEMTIRSPTMTLRSLRLLRLLRLLRMFRMFDYLQKFVDALFEMFPTLVWIFTILFIFCYVTAIVLTHMLGKLEAFSMPISKDEEEDLHEYFGDVVTTMFTLFRIITMDSWHDVARPVVDNLPSWRLFFVAFIAFGSWTMISLLTAVVSDHMIAATADLKAVEARKAHELKLDFIDYLQFSFHQADTDGDKMLDRSEFVDWVEDEQTMKRLHKVGIDMRKDEMIAMFDMFDIDDCGKLSIDEFVDGFARAQDSLGMKHMLMLEHLFKRVERKVGSNTFDLQGLTRYVQAPLKQNQEDLRAQMKQLTEQVQEIAAQQSLILEAVLHRNGPSAAATSTPRRPSR